MSNRTSRAIKGSITGLFQQFLAILLQLTLAPLILSYSGQNILGAYAVIIQIIGFSLLMDFGFSVAFTRYLSHAHNPSVTGSRFRDLLTVGRNVLFITNLMVAVMLVAAAWNIDFFLSENSEINLGAQTALYIMALWLIMRTPLYIYSFALTATQDLATLNVIGVAVNFARLATTLTFVYLEWGLPGLVLASILSELLGGYIQWLIFRRRHKRYQPQRVIGNIKIAKEMVRFGLWYWGVNLSAVLLLGSDNLVAASLYGAATASVFYTTKMFGSLLIGFISKIIDHAYPGMNQIINSGDFESLKQVYLRLLRYLLLITFPAMIGTVIFLKGLVTLWVGSQQFGGQFMAYALAFLLLIQVLCHLNGITVLALGKINNWPIFSICCGSVAVLGSYYMGRDYGMGWIILSFALAMLPLLGFLTLRVMKLLNITIWELLCASKPAFSAVIPIIIFAFFLAQLTWSVRLVNLIILLSIFLLIFFSTTWLIGLQKSERNKILGTVKLYLFSA